MSLARACRFVCTQAPVVRLEQREREVRARIQRVCGHLSRHEFDRLVRRVAMTALRFELSPESFADLERAIADRGSQGNRRERGPLPRVDVSLRPQTRTGR